MAAQKMEENVASVHEFFRLIMEKKWKEVESFYRTNEWSQKAKLTKSEDTALHILISCYHQERAGHDANIVNKMLDSISTDEVYNVLSMKNSRGNTPLHLVATVGWVEICQSIALKDPELVQERNKKGETPLFAAACHGETEAFICLYNILTILREREKKSEKQEKKPEKQAEEDENSNKSLCRRKSDGNTALHLAITGAYFELAYQIIEYIPELVDFKNVDGESPIHILAKMPRLFKSSSHMGLYDSIIYHCITIKELTQQRHILRANQNVISSTNGVHYPENYQTCVKIFKLLWDPIYKTCQAIRRDTGNMEHGGRNDTESQRTTSNVSQKEESKVQSYFPANYATAILLFEFAVKVILSVLGVGFGRIKKIQDNKKRHSQALQIMDRMIESESGYMYDSDGQKPQQKLEHNYLVEFRPPESPPASHDERDAPQSSIKPTSVITSSNDVQDTPGKEKDQVESVKNAIRSKVMSNETPFLVAAWMGIPEMVEKILTRFPVALLDLDSNGKNVLLLAVQNKQPAVFEILLKMKAKEHMFRQLDNQGNSILHLAAMMGPSHPWRIPGAALQMQWELKWYKYVKHNIPAHYLAPQNSDGHTSREVFTDHHQKVVEDGTKWLIKTSESCSLVAALIATVAFATSATIPGGVEDKTGRPTLAGHKEFDIFSLSSLIALCLAVTALVFFLAVISSRAEERDFKRNLTGKLFYGLTSLFASIAAILVSFCAGHTFILKDKLRIVAIPIYAFAGVPVTLFAFAQLPLYFDLLQVSFRKVPLRSFKAFYQ